MKKMMRRMRNMRMRMLALIMIMRMMMMMMMMMTTGAELQMTMVVIGGTHASAALVREAVPAGARTRGVAARGLNDPWRRTAASPSSLAAA